MSDRYDDWINVVPAPGEHKQAAADLLEIADSVHDVRTVGNGTEFLVAPYVGEAYNGTSKRAPRKRRAPAKKTDAAPAENETED